LSSTSRKLFLEHFSPRWTNYFPLEVFNLDDFCSFMQAFKEQVLHAATLRFALNRGHWAALGCIGLGAGLRLGWVGNGGIDPESLNSIGLRNSIALTCFG
jgi:hypothetical protein